jgi:hypothetical protein
VALKIPSSLEENHPLTVAGTAWSLFEVPISRLTAFEDDHWRALSTTSLYHIENNIGHFPRTLESISTQKYVFCGETLIVVRF